MKQNACQMVVLSVIGRVFVVFSLSKTASIVQYGQLSRQPIADMTFKQTPIDTLKRAGVPRYRLAVT